MPRALVIEFSGSRSGVALTNSNGHGNTVRSTFLAFAPVGWTCDVVESQFDFGVAFLSWFDSRASSYDLCICSNTVDLYYARVLDALTSTYAKPCFFSIANNPPTTNEGIYVKRGNFVYSGGGIDSNTAASSLRTDTFAQATNLSLSSSVLTSFTNAVVAAKAANLVTEGLTPLQIAKAVRQQGTTYPTWTTQNGFGKAPAGNYSVPVSYDKFPPASSGMYRLTGNTLSIYFLIENGESPIALNVYRNGVLDGTYASNTWEDVNNIDTTLPVSSQKRVFHIVESDGGSFTFNLTFQFADGESQMFGWNEAVVSGFTDNNVDPAPPEPEPEPTPPEDPIVPEVPETSLSLVPQFMLAPKKYQFNLVKKSQISEAPKGIGFMVIGSTFRVS